MGTPAQAAEAARQLTVLAERVGESREAGDRRDHGGEQDQRAGDADVEPERVAESRRQLGADRVGDAEQRRVLPGRAELRVRARERRQRDDGDRDVRR